MSSPPPKYDESYLLRGADISLSRSPAPSSGSWVDLEAERCCSPVEGYQSRHRGRLRVVNGDPSTMAEAAQKLSHPSDSPDADPREGILLTEIQPGTRPHDLPSPGTESSIFSHAPNEHSGAHAYSFRLYPVDSGRRNGMDLSRSDLDLRALLDEVRANRAPSPADRLHRAPWQNSRVRLMDLENRDDTVRPGVLIRVWRRSDRHFPVLTPAVAKAVQSWPVRCALAVLLATMVTTVALVVCVWLIPHLLDKYWHTFLPDSWHHW